ncbi:hypothetical protein KDX27_09425 [Burkholderia cenocepacia]|uniref:hypothetical protein n=1 Tax=Burkholderia cenocepacia TaxID=95486 RepID=UPI001BA159F5|nr:hypothetical protein [Burkholderia cenocepacia]MBR8167929.1 hypothetical protein [Burkholderia cenocepacia]
MPIDIGPACSRRRFLPTPAVARVVLAAAATVIMAGCAQPLTAFKPGDSEATLTARLGTPPETYDLPNGGKRLMWPTGPLGTRTTAADISADGRIQSIRQVLQLREFSQARVGAWTKHDVLVHFGRPAESKSTPGSGNEVWSYRFRDAGIWQGLYNFYFDRAGVLRLTQESPDPMRQTGDTLY